MRKLKKSTFAAFIDFKKADDGINSYSQLAFFVNLQRAVIGPSASLMGR